MILLPDVRQRKDFDCGVAAVETVLKLFGLPRPPDLSNPIDGTAPDTVEALLRKAGLLVAAGHLTVSDLKHFTDRGAPVLCPITVSDGGHWVTVRGVQRLRVHYQDPETGPQSLKASDWDAGWTGGTRTGRDYSGWGIAAWTPKSVTARRS
jgi:predicted double-glycine peptidase